MTVSSHENSLVFVYGALRSGTTVFRLMLDAHPNISNPGEMDFLFDHLQRDASHPSQWRYNFDALTIDRIFQSSKLIIPAGLDGLDLLDDFFTQLIERHDAHSRMSINVHRNVDRICEILPKARYIHVLRDPRDVARSSIAMGWAHNLYYGVDHWIKTETSWDDGAASIPPEQLLTLTYENLFLNIETQLKDVCTFLEVPWHAGMLMYHETSTYSPPDPTLIEQWKRKCTQADLDLLEGKASELMEKRGYAMSGSGCTPTQIQRSTMAAKQKLFHWSFGSKRYGPVLFFGEKVLRSARLSRLARPLQQKINDINRTLVK